MSAGPFSAPPTSAAVLEFICLFTHDLKRKQKRWQDGRLDYHTFNNRVVVHDDRGNFVGDMHWRNDWDLAEGEEVHLERGGVIVQVQELKSRREQNLSELVDKRAKEKEKRQMQAAARTPNPSVLPRTVVRPVATRPGPPSHSLQQHRPLHRLIGTPTGHHGRALVPKESPFEQRQEAAESPDQRAAKRRRHNDPPPSKSGYASALFGQALTLSAAPMSSLPVISRNTIPERDPSPEEEVFVLPVREEPNASLREQRTCSDLFNQAVERSRQLKPAKNTLSNRHVSEDDDQSEARRKQDRSLLKKRPKEPRTEPILINDDVQVAEIDDSGTNVIEDTRCVGGPEETATKPPKKRKKTTAKFTPAPARQPSNDGLSKSDEIEKSMDEELIGPQDVSKKQERLSKSKKSKTKNSKPVNQKVAPPPKNLEAPTLETLRRNPDDPVTELRLKSRKKRGLMMMSDMSMKPRGRTCRDSNTTNVAIGIREASEIEETNYSFRSPSPQSGAKAAAETDSGRSKTSNQLANSVRLEDDDGSFSFPSPELRAVDSGETDHTGEAPLHQSDSFELGADNDLFPSPTLPHLRMKTQTNMSSDFAVAERIVSSELGEDYDRFRLLSPVPPSEVGPPVEKQGADIDFLGSIPDDDLEIMDIGEAAAKPVNDPMPNAIGKSSPPRKVYDPYRVPSSSSEDLAEPRAQQITSPKAESAPNGRRGEVPANDESSDERQQTAYNEKRKKSKRRRPLRKNMILDDDDERDIFSDTNGPAETADAVDLNSDINLPVPIQQIKPMKATKRKSKVQVDFEIDQMGSDLGDAPPKQRLRPRRSSKATKRKSKVQEEDLGVDPEDEQPIKRRRGTRKTRGRVMEPEETALSSSQQASEKEAHAKQSRTKKATMASDGRPRLKRIKKSVKSREVIGFNISALSTPSLGLRGLGMPFSILSSPANESLQERIDTHAALGPSSHSLLDDVSDEQVAFPTSDALQSIVEAGTVALERLLSPVAEGRFRPSAQVHGEDLDKPQSRDSDHTTRAALTGLVSLEDNMPRHWEPGPSKSDHLSAPETTSLGSAPCFSTLSGPGPSHQRQFANAPKAPATIETPRSKESSDCHLAEASAANTQDKNTAKANFNPREEAPAVTKGPKLPIALSRAAPKPPVDVAGTWQGMGLMAKPCIPSLKSCIRVQNQRHTASANIDFDDGTPEGADVEVNFGSVVAAILPAVKRPDQKATATLQREHTSTVSVISSDRAAPNEVEFEDIEQVKPIPVPALPAFKRPDQIPLSQREPSHAARADTDFEIIGEIELELDIKAAPATLSALPAFKRPNQKAVPSLQQRIVRATQSGAEDEQTDKPTDNGNGDDLFDRVVAEDWPQHAESSTQKPVTRARRQPASFKPPTKARTTRHIERDIETSTSTASEQKNADLQSTNPTRALSRPPSHNADRTTAGAATAANTPAASATTPAAPAPAARARRPTSGPPPRPVSPSRRNIHSRIAAAPPPPAATGTTLSAAAAESSSTKAASNGRVLTNPASRGRKAAVKADARGPVPQRMLPPTQPFAAGGPAATAHLAATPVDEPPPQEPARAKKKKMTFPGFQSARDEGPWSREAYDLLESGRP